MENTMENAMENNLEALPEVHETYITASGEKQVSFLKVFFIELHETHATCHSVTIYFIKKNSFFKFL